MAVLTINLEDGNAVTSSAITDQEACLLEQMICNASVASVSVPTATGQVKVSVNKIVSSSKAP